MKSTNQVKESLTCLAAKVPLRQKKKINHRDNVVAKEPESIVIIIIVLFQVNYNRNSLQ